MHGYSLLRTQLNNDYFNDIFTYANKFEIPLEGHRACIVIHSLLASVMTSSADTETGPGVFETALAYTTAFRMADNALLFKYLVKSIGMKHGIIPSFMAKPWGNVSVSFACVILFFYTNMVVCSSCLGVVGL